MNILNEYTTYLKKNRDIENSDYPSFIKDILKYRNKKKTYNSMVSYRYMWKKYYFKLTDITVDNFFSLITLILGNSTSMSFRAHKDGIPIGYDILLKLSSYTLNNELLSSANLYITEYAYNEYKMKSDTTFKILISVTKKINNPPIISVYIDDYINYMYSNKTLTDKGWEDTLYFNNVFGAENGMVAYNFDTMFTIIYAELIRELLEDY